MGKQLFLFPKNYFTSFLLFIFTATRKQTGPTRAMPTKIPKPPNKKGTKIPMPPQKAPANATSVKCLLGTEIKVLQTKNPNRRAATVIETTLSVLLISSVVDAIPRTTQATTDIPSEKNAVKIFCM